jgi:glycosyltransferase involved in cell wall biosynthesis
LSQGKPVIAPRAQGILDYFGLQDLVFFELGDSDDLAKKMVYVFKSPEEMLKVTERGKEIFREHNWSSERQRFLNIVDDLLNRPGSSAAFAKRRAISILGSRE